MALGGTLVQLDDRTSNAVRESEPKGFGDYFDVGTEWVPNDPVTADYLKSGHRNQPIDVWCRDEDGNYWRMNELAGAKYFIDSEKGVDDLAKDEVYLRVVFNGQSRRLAISSVDLPYALRPATIELPKDDQVVAKALKDLRSEPAVDDFEENSALEPQGSENEQAKNLSADIDEYKRAFEAQSESLLHLASGDAATERAKAKLSAKQKGITDKFKEIIKSGVAEKDLKSLIQQTEFDTELSMRLQQEADHLPGHLKLMEKFKQRGPEPFKRKPAEIIEESPDFTMRVEADNAQPAPVPETPAVLADVGDQPVEPVVPMAPAVSMTPTATTEPIAPVEPSKPAADEIVEDNFTEKIIAPAPVETAPATEAGESSKTIEVEPVEPPKPVVQTPLPASAAEIPVPDIATPVETPTQKEPESVKDKVRAWFITAGGGDITADEVSHLEKDLDKEK